MKILFPVDGSEYSVHAAHVIARRAELQNFNPEVCVLNVQKAAELMIPALKLRRSAATNRQSEAAFKKVRDILKNVMTEEKVVIGNPAQVIAEEADREKADLIVMGSRGLSDFAKLFLGSVSTAVLARTTVPVMLIRSEYTSEPGKELKVCVAVDGSPYSEAAARYIVAHRKCSVKSRMSAWSRWWMWLKRSRMSTRRMCRFLKFRQSAKPLKRIWMRFSS